MIKETIAAIATGMSNSGIGIIRMSGPEAISIADGIFVSARKNFKLSEAATHTVHYGNIVYEDNIIDEVLIIIMKAPNSYTREDVVEIDCHGGVYVMKKILDILIKSGARTAEPGEFTKRAFLNGRIDLTQAEAVIDIINSKNKYALSNSVKLLNGKLSEQITKIRKDLINNIAYIEAALDDPEHISLDNYGDKLLITVDNYIDKVDNLIKTVDNGKIFTQGVKTVIIGKPNAGKSSILNILAGYDRAIVTDIAGTTRDTIEEQINLAGITLNLVDTAGIRNTKDIVEEIGVNKAKELVEEADLILYVVDSSTELDENDYNILNIIKNRKTVILLNKSDLDTVTDADSISKITDSKVISVSAKDNTGLDELSETIVKLFASGEIDYNDEVYVSGERNKEALEETLESLKLVKKSINEGLPEDFYTIDLMNAYEQLGKITGESVEDDLVNEIFSKFCMGK
jgi:tRNA modification GTPase